MANSAFNISGCGGAGGSGGTSSSCSGWSQISKVSSIVQGNIVGSVELTTNLNPSYTGSTGDTYITTDDDHAHSWNGATWDDLGYIGNEIQYDTSGNIIPADEISVLSDRSLEKALRRIAEVNSLTNSNRIADDVSLHYDCPKQGDAVFWNPVKEAYDLASAEIDDANLSDPEHMIESLAVVEDVFVTCQENADIPTGGYKARVVFFGKITFDEFTTELDPGKVYYLADHMVKAFAPDSKFLGNNAIHADYEPVISKPLFIATGKHTAIVTNYRPLTGSPTGGVPATEEYTLEVTPKEFLDETGNLIDIGWEIKVANVGTVASRNQLFLQLEYNRLTGPQDPNLRPVATSPTDDMLGDEIYVHFIDIGILYTEPQANLNEDDDIKSEVTYNFAEHNNSSWAMNGIGELTARLKIFTQSTANINFADRIGSPEVRVTNTDDLQTGRLVPTLDEVSPTGCMEDPTIDDIFISPDGTIPPANVEYEEGAVFELTLLDSYPMATESDQGDLAIKIPMNDDLGFVIEGLDHNDDIDPTWEKIYGDFSLVPTTRESVEIIPMTSAEKTITDKKVRLRLVGADESELHENHWAYQYSSSMATTSCDSAACCKSDSDLILIPQGTQVPISEILTNGDTAIINNRDNAVFYTKNIDDPSFHAWQEGDQVALTERIAVSWKNMREKTSFCYPSTPPGTTPSFLTIYADEARPMSAEFLATHDPTGVGAHLYDPRYTLMEIGAQDVLEGQPVRITINSGDSGGPDTYEWCYEIRFCGTFEGSHYTLSELMIGRFGGQAIKVSEPKQRTITA